jgi:ketol-acid reductoisomerase
MLSIQKVNNFVKSIKNISRSFKREISTISINGIHEEIIERSDYPINKCQEILSDKLISVIGYGPQGRSQSLNLRDNNINVCIGLRKGPSWDKALEEGWTEGKDLFDIEEACNKGNIIQYLLSDVGQIQQWDKVKPHLKENDTLYFSHGFGITYKDKTNIIPPDNIDVTLVAPKGAGSTVRNHFLNGSGINVSYAIHQDYSGKAKENTLALAFAIGCGHAFETSFEKEVYSDLTGERCVLMGLIQGAFLAQYNVLRENGHSPSEAYNETVEEALESLFPLISAQGMDWLYANCSTTAQIGALDWAPKFEGVLKPVIEECYNSVLNGTEADIVIKANSTADYRNKLNKGLEEINSQELWQAAKILRNLRP